ncbi:MULTISPECIES: hypothetical protein [Enterococcus]|uniref:hypothetical protein n=2 Tax=Enterococcus TaxID=1350 RepID=UPI0012FE1F05|nr:MULTISPECIES: hypothetical protein [Enterococcus]MBS5820824.1 hypothetical protein [Enterococcus gilvus]MDN6004844.1 hypothetical protein [Enterococcus sp.]MDN6518539.1 hypothetical protein [Enterococcus sp.]MDN6561197.1 hypothetical protein [Enterococcus sp.]MDN6649285.1 hypothetical protein [Enterococcus sp.]
MIDMKIFLLKREKRTPAISAGVRLKSVDGWNRTNTSVLNADYIIERVKHQVHPRLSV